MPDLPETPHDDREDGGDHRAEQQQAPQVEAGTPHPVCEAPDAHEERKQSGPEQSEDDRGSHDNCDLSPAVAGIQQRHPGSLLACRSWQVLHDGTDQHLKQAAAYSVDRHPRREFAKTSRSV